MQKQCQLCNVTFETEHEEKLYCTKECKVRAKSRRYRDTHREYVRQKKREWRLSDKGRELNREYKREYKRLHRDAENKRNSRRRKKRAELREKQSKICCYCQKTYTKAEGGFCKYCSVRCRKAAKRRFWRTNQPERYRAEVRRYRERHADSLALRRIQYYLNKNGIRADPEAWREMRKLIAKQCEVEKKLTQPRKGLENEEAAS